MTDRIPFLLGKLNRAEPLTAAEHSDCLRFGINPEGRPRPRPRLAPLAIASGCSAQTFRRIFG